jgi:hypothetical protein
MQHKTYFASIALSMLLASVAMAATPDVASIASQGQLDVAIASTSDTSVKEALQANRAAILAAIEQHSHVEAVTKTVDSAHGTVEQINTTPDSLKKVAGGEMAVFDTLKAVDLAVPNTGPHDKRTFDPYDSEFFEHLGHIASLESLNVISTKLDDKGIAPIANLTNLKTLRFTNNGKLSDVGLAKLAGLKNIQTFNFVGTAITGQGFTNFNGWTHLTKCSFRGSSINDPGLQQICEHFPNLQSISLAHAKFSDAGAVHLAKLTKLNGLEIGTHNATPACLKNLTGLPIEYLQLGDGLDGPDGIAACQGIPTLRRLTLTHCEHLPDEGLKLGAKLTQLQQLEIDGLELPPERLPQLASLGFLKELKLVRRPTAYPAETQSSLKSILPGVKLSFQ